MQIKYKALVRPLVLLFVIALTLASVQNANATSNISLENVGSATFTGAPTTYAGNALNTAYLENASGKFLFVATSTSNSINVIDMTNPVSPYTITTTSSPYKFATDTSTNPYTSMAVIVDVCHNLYARNEGGRSYLYATYTAVAGSVYKLKKIDVTNPEAPSIVNDYITDVYTRDFTVMGDYAYVLRAGIKVFDTKTTGTNSVPVSTVSLAAVGSSGKGVIATHGSNLVVGAYYSTFDVQYITMTSPTAGSAVAKDLTPDIKKVVPNVDLAGNSMLGKIYFKGMVIIGHYAYLPLYDPNGIKESTERPNVDIGANLIMVVDLNKIGSAGEGVYSFKPDNSILKTSTGAAYASGTSSTWFKPKSIIADGNLLYIGDYNSRVWVYDVSVDPTNPTLLNVIQNNNTLISGAVNSIAKAGNYFVLALDGGKVQILKSNTISMTANGGLPTVRTLPLTFTGKSSGGSKVALTIGTNAPVDIPIDANGDWEYVLNDIPNNVNNEVTTIKAELQNATGSVITSVISSLKVNVQDVTFDAPLYTQGAGGMNITVNASNPTPNNQQVTLVAALFRGNQFVRMASNLITVPGDIDGNSPKIAPISLTIDTSHVVGDSSSTEYSIQTFAINSVNGMVPLSGANVKILE